MRILISSRQANAPQPRDICITTAFLRPSALRCLRLPGQLDVGPPLHCPNFDRRCTSRIPLFSTEQKRFRPRTVIQWLQHTTLPPNQLVQLGQRWLVLTQRGWPCDQWVRILGLMTTSVHLRLLPFLHPPPLLCVRNPQETFPYSPHHYLHFRQAVRSRPLQVR
jgi:hypothetical protein